MAITNISRISKLEKPKYYQCYRLRFYVWLICFDAVIALMAQFIQKTFVSTLILGSLDCMVSFCLGGTLFIYFMKWDSFNLIIRNEATADILHDSSTKQNYHLLVEDEESNTKNNLSSNSVEITEEEAEEVPPPVVDFFFGWVKYL